MLKQNEPVFNGDFVINSGGFTPVVNIWDDNIPVSQLKNIVIIANFNVTTQNVVPNFPFTGTWYNLMDNSSINVTDTAAPITLQPGEYRIYGNQATTVSAPQIEALQVDIYPNPADNYITSNQILSKLEIYDVSGKLIKVFNQKQDTPMMFPVHELPAGFYLIKAYQNKHQITKKLIINH